MTINSYKDLIVWQKAVGVVIEVYKLTEKYPNEEKYILTRETRRSAISIPSNIAEGRHRGTSKDFTRFLQIAFASGAELETQLTIAERLKVVSDVELANIQSKLTEVMKMLNVMLYKMKK